MKTYQDLLACQNDTEKIAFILSAIADHTASEQYRTAELAEQYFNHQNPTIMRLQKLIYNVRGQAVPDIYAANNKIPSRYYFYFVIQLVQYLLGNGVLFQHGETKDKLGGAAFDYAVQDAAEKAINAGVSFSFYNYDHIDVFSLLEFVPLYDEETGALCAGIRFWRLDNNHPMRVTLYEIDGYTEYRETKRDSEKPNDRRLEILREKRTYIQTVETSRADGERIVDGANYDGFPIVPLYNIARQSDIVGNRGTIDAYDLMTSQLVNNIDDGNFIYWVLKNCGGMSEEDDERFIEQLKITHTAHVEGDSGAEIESRTIEVPYEASRVSLDQLRKQLFDDFMALDVKEIASGAVTATQIEAAYEPLNAKADKFEMNVTAYIQALLKLAGVTDDAPTYNRSKLVNKSDEVKTVLECAEYLGEEYTVKKLLAILGDIDEVDNVMTQKAAEENNIFHTETEETE